MLLSRLDTLKKKFEAFCATGRYPFAFHDMYFEAVDDGRSNFTFCIQEIEFSIPKYQSWKKILSDTLEKYDFAQKIFKHLYNNIPCESILIYIIRIDTIITIVFEHYRTCDHVIINVSSDDMQSMLTNHAKWIEFKQALIPRFVFNQECPVCLTEAENVEVMTSCEECHQDVCLSCTIQSIRVKHGLHQCPFCRHIEHDCRDDSRDQSYTKNYIKDLVDDYLQ
jgi:hypothetical protein